MSAKHIGEADSLSLIVEEFIVPRLSAKRQGSALLGDPLNVSAKLDFLGEQRHPSSAVRLTVIGIGFR